MAQKNFNKTEIEVFSVCKYLGNKKAAIITSIDSLTTDYVYAGAVGEIDLEKLQSYLGCLLSLKERHPQLKVTITFAPMHNRLDIRNSPLLKQWVLSIQRDYSWIEIADHGLTHLKEDEFDPYFNPNSLSAEYCERNIKLIREIFDDIGLDNQEIIGFRGPECRWTEPAVDALLKHGFKYNLVKGRLEYLFRPIIRKVGKGRRYVEGFNIYPFYHETDAGNRMLFVPTNAPLNEERFEDYYTYIILKGGVVSFTYHLEETLLYDLFEKKLGFLESPDSSPLDGLNGDQLWWCTAGELARYFMKRDTIEVEDVRLQDDFLSASFSIESDISFPTSLLFGVEPKNLQSIIINGEEASCEKTSTGIMITQDFRRGKHRIELKFRGDAITIEPTKGREEEIANSIYQKWMSQAEINRKNNAITFLMMISVLICIPLLSGTTLPLLGYILMTLLGLVSILALSYRTGIVQTSITATGFDTPRKALMYARHIGFSSLASHGFSLGSLWSNIKSRF